MLCLFLTASCQTYPAIRTETVEVTVEVTVPLRSELTADVEKPPRPAPACTSATSGKPVLCTAQLASWLNGYDAVVDQLRAQLAGIRAVQPAPAPPLRPPR